MRKSTICATLALALALAIGGLAQAGQFVMKWADGQGPTHTTVKMAENLAKAVAERSGGRIELQVYSAGQLGSARDTIEGVSLGIHEAVVEGPAMIAQFVPSIGVTEAPYVWRDVDHMTKVFAGPIGEAFNQELIKKSNMRILGVTYYGTRQLTTTVKEVRHVEDMKNLKIRVPENDIYVAMMDAWGAKATPSSFSELYLALKQGVVDGQENPIPTIDSAKFNEIQKYLVLTQHVINPRVLLVNESFWQGMPQELRDIFMEELVKAIAWNNKTILEQEGELIDKLAASGMTVIRPDVEEFRKPVLEALPPKFEAKWGKGMWDKVQAVK